MTESVDLTTTPVDILTSANVTGYRRYSIELVDGSAGGESARYVVAENAPTVADVEAFHSLAEAQMQDVMLRPRTGEKIWMWMPSGTGTLAVTSALPRWRGEHL